MNPLWIDTHCHLDYPDYADMPATLAAMAGAGVGAAVSIGVDAAGSTRACQLAAAHPGRVWATIGAHPCHTHEAQLPAAMAALHMLLQQHRGHVVAVGECGLDNHYWDGLPAAEVERRMLIQRQFFAAQAAFAAAAELPVVVHLRDAPVAEAIAILQGAGCTRAVFHSTTLGAAEAQQVWDAGYHTGFSGIVTFKNATDIQETARACPAHLLLVETDAPYLAPVPHRGQRNTPAWVPHTGAALAALRGVSVDEMARQSTENAEKFFNITVQA